MALATLSACGGGGGAGPATPVPVPVPVAAITISGTAARGAALVGATVSVKCAAGTSTAASGTTAASGAYSISITGGSLPCALRVSGSGGVVFHSVLAGSGSSGSFTANLTPLTEMLVARMAGVAPGSFFDGFGSGSSVSTSSQSQALAYLKSALSSVTDLGTIQPVTDVLTVGDAQDKKIEATVAAIAAAALTLPAVTDAIVANAAAPGVISSALAGAAADCAWFKSGTYRVLGPYNGSAVRRLGKAQINAATLTGTDAAGQAISLVSTGPCQYGLVGETGWTTRFNVSSASMAAVHGQSTTTSERNFEFAIPEQALPVSELAGTWNAMSWYPSAPSGTRTFQPTVHELSLTADGQVTALLNCTGLAACTPQHPAPFSRFVPNTVDGGFDEILPSGALWSRLFLHKSISGSRVLVLLSPDGQFVVAAPKKPLGALPAVGDIGNWRDLLLNGDGTLAALTEGNYTVVAVDPAVRSVSRRRASDRRVDTQLFDLPRDGLRHRALNACTIDGAPVLCAEFVQMPIGGMTITGSVPGTPGTPFFIVSVAKP